MKKSKTTKILQIFLVIAIFIFCGVFLFDFYTSQNNEKEISSILDEFDKKVEENKIEMENQNNIIYEEDKLTGNKNSENKNSKNITPKKITKNNNTQIKKTYNEESVTIEEYSVYGKIKIEKIGIEYPIIKYVDEDSLWKSICKISDNHIDGIGNLCLAGHNMRNSTMFAKIKKLRNGDKVEITNIYGEKYVYLVYDSFYVEANDVEVLKETDEPIITLITCNNIGNKRLIVRAKLNENAR